MSKNDMDEKKKKFKIPSKIKSYKIEKELYEISTAHVCIGTNLNINEKVLIKIYEKEKIQYFTEELYLINNEIFMMKFINHKNTLNLYEIIESPSYIFLIMEYFNGIKLSEQINKKKKLSEDDALNIYKQILSVLLYLHDMNIGHLNINSNNILIDSSNNIKICEFKYSVFYSSNDRTKIPYFGEISYLSPELCSKKSCYPELSDIWSSGVILYLMTVGELPFISHNDLDLQKLIMKAEFKLPSNMNKNMQDYFRCIFEEKEDERYGFDEIFDSNLFKQKKINKNSLSLGFNILSAKYPTDERALNICSTNFNIEPEDIKQKLRDNIFDPQTSLYKQIINKFTNKKISTDGDLISKKYNSYMNNEKNYFEGNVQKRNIQNILNKEGKFKNTNKGKVKEMDEIQAQALYQLEDILKLYKKRKEKNSEENQSDKEDNKNADKKKKKDNKDNNAIKPKSSIKKKNTLGKILHKNTINDDNSSIAKTNSLKKKGKIKFEKNINLTSVNKKRRMSSNVNMDDKLKASLEKFKDFQMNQMNKNTKKKKNFYNQNKADIIEESKEEYEEKFIEKRKRSASFRNKKSSVQKPIIENEKSNSSSQSNSNKKINVPGKKKSIKEDQNTSDNKSRKVQFKENKENIDSNSIAKVEEKTPPSADNKNKVSNTDNSNANKEKSDGKNTLVNKKSSKNFKKEKYISYAAKQEDFFNQIKNVKLKKMGPKEEKKKLELNADNFSVNNMKALIEQRLKNTHIMDTKTGKEIKNKNFIKGGSKSVQKKTEENKEKEKQEKPNTKEHDLKSIRKQLEEKYINAKPGPANSTKGRRNAPRKSVNYANAFMFPKKSIELNTNEIKRVKTNKFKLDGDDIIFENEAATPKFKKKDEKKKKVQKPQKVKKKKK